MIPEKRRFAMYGKVKPGIALNQIIILLGVCFMAASCNFQPSDQQKPQSVPGDSIPGMGSGSFITANSYADLVKMSTLIAIGRVIKTENIINMARDPNDPTKPDNQVFIVGQVYKVHFMQFLKGEEGDTLYVVQREGFLGPSMSKTEAEIEKAKTNEDYIPLSLDKDYLMFLEPMLGFPERGYYVGVAQPWRFDLSDTNKVLPESPWHEAIRIFPPQALESIVQQIEDPELFLTTPFLSPTTPPYP
jgi:hypothetical protein